MPPASPYSHAALTGEEPELTLADIPLDAPYQGDHVLYRWSAVAQAWVGYDAWVTHLDSGETFEPESTAPKKAVRARSPKRRRKGDPDPELPLLDGRAS
jgi:hypothetical protein